MVEKGGLHMNTIMLSSIDWLIILIYFAAVIGIGYYLKKFMNTKEDFFEAGRRNSAWVAGIGPVSWLFNRLSDIRFDR